MSGFDKDTGPERGRGAACAGAGAGGGTDGGTGGLTGGLTGSASLTGIAPTHPDVIEEPYMFQRLLGFRMVDWTPERVVIEMPLREELTNRYGIPHGGVHASLLDTCLGFSGCFTGDPNRKRRAMTLQLNVQYLSRPKGAVLIGTGRKTGGGRSTFFAEGEIADETGELIARGSGTFRYRKEG